MVSVCYVVLLLCCVYSEFINSAVLKNDLYKLDIIHYNDFHDRFEETSVPYPVCKSNDTSCLGGFARLYAGVKQLLEEKPDALLLNAGDTFQGTYWYTLLKWDVIQHFINMLPNDAHAIGNHEFDDGITGLAPYLAALRAPVVAANLDASKEPSLRNLYKPHVIVKRKGRKIGIIGLITPETAISSSAENMIFTDPIEAAKTQADILTQKGVDIIIVLSHCGLNVDKEIASKVGDNVDIIVGGHSHSLLWNGESPSKESIAGPYPVLIESKKKPGHKVLVVTASAFSKYLGNMTAYFDQEGELQSFDGSPLFLNRSIQEDAEMKELLKPYKTKLHGLVNEVVGEASDDYIADSCGSRECAIGDMTADAFLVKAHAKNVSNLPHVAFLLRNMIRGSIAKGDINRGAVINAFPFMNKVVTFTIQGRYILEVMEKSLTVYWNEIPFNGPYMPQVAGIKLTLNTTDKSVVSLLVKEADEYKPLEADKDYQFVTLQFLAKGGNGFKMLQENGRDQVYIGQDSKILEEYIRRLSPITPTLDNRLTIVT